MRSRSILALLLVMVLAFTAACSDGSVDPEELARKQELYSSEDEGLAGSAGFSEGSNAGNSDPGDAEYGKTDLGYGTVLADFLLNPVYDIELNGNFEDIDESVFANTHYGSDMVVGRWYEDGWTDSCCLELYGDGTWCLFGSESDYGVYELINNSCNLYDYKYGVSVASFMPYKDGGGYVLSVSVNVPELFQINTPDTNVIFKSERLSKACDDIEAYYNERFPYRELAGNYYLMGDDTLEQFYIIQADGGWIEVIDGGSENSGGFNGDPYEGLESTGTNGEPITFQYLGGDGYMLINGASYERQDASKPPVGVLGHWRFYDTEERCLVEDGYVFESVWFYYQLPEGGEMGTYTVKGDNILLYDGDGNQIHKFFQNVYMGKRKIFDDKSGDKFADLYYESLD